MIPAFVNDSAGTASGAREALEQVGGFEVHEVAPSDLSRAIKSELEATPQRIVVAGGDGSVGTAAGLVCGTPTELAILPGGTLNHFARDHGIPTALDEAARVAAHGVDATADVAYVHKRLFLNTSSVGAYVSYVKLRDRLERYVGYKLASFFAAVRLFVTLRPIPVEIEFNGERRMYSTPIVFIGVGEREMKSPEFGSRVPGGKHCLHVIIVRERRAARLLAVAMDAAMRGLASVAATPELDSFMVDSLVVGLAGRARSVAVDGEIVRMESPLRYRLARNALRIVVPADEAASE